MSPEFNLGGFRRGPLEFRAVDSIIKSLNSELAREPISDIALQIAIHISVEYWEQVLGGAKNLLPEGTFVKLVNYIFERLEIRSPMTGKPLELSVTEYEGDWHIRVVDHYDDVPPPSPFDDLTHLN